MNKSETLAENIVKQKGWRGEVKLTEKGVKQLIQFCYKRGYNQGIADATKEDSKTTDDDFGKIFGAMFKDYTGKDYSGHEFS